MTRLKDLYMKTRRKILLIAGSISLALGVGISAQAPAEPVAVTIDATAASADRPSQSSTGQISTTPDLNTKFSQAAETSDNTFPIVFREFRSYEELIKMFPEARALIERFGINPETPDGIPDIYSEGYFAKVSDSLYIFRSEAPGECGALGCAVNTFSLGEEFYVSAYIMSPAPPSVARIDENGEPSIFTCNRDGHYYEWKRRGTLEMTAERQPKDCTEPDVSNPPPAPKP